MTSREEYLEHLEKAAASLEFLRSDLQAANAHGTAMESLLLLPMIRQAAELQQALEALRDAEERDAEEEAK